MDEEMILVGIKKHQEQYLQVAIDQYGRLVYQVVYNIMAHQYPSDIEDIVSETFMELWNKAYLIDLQKGSLKNRICLIARSRTIDFLRKNGSPKDLLDQEKFEEEVDHHSPEEYYMDKEAAQGIYEAIVDLGEPDTTIIMKRYFYLESIEQIAQYFQVDRSYIDNRISRARKKLRALFSIA